MPVVHPRVSYTQWRFPIYVQIAVLWVVAERENKVVKLSFEKQKKNIEADQKIES